MDPRRKRTNWVTRTDPGVVSQFAELRGHELLLEERGGTWPICPAAPAAAGAGITGQGGRSAGDPPRPRDGLLVAQSSDVLK
jgi:hypothetical protein